MPHWKLLYPSKYVGSHDIKDKIDDITITISGVSVQELVMVGGVKDHKPVLTFSDASKDLVLNKTNAGIIADLHGSDTDNWTGKQITIYATTTRFGRETVPCIRIREKGYKPRTAAPAAALQPPVPAPEPVAEQDPEAAYAAEERAAKEADAIATAQDMFEEKP